MPYQSYYSMADSKCDENCNVLILCQNLAKISFVYRAINISLTHICEKMM